MFVGIFDPNRPFDTPDQTFPMLVNLRAQIIRVNLDWFNVAKKRPEHPIDPKDPVYNWDRYDALVLNAKKNKIQVLFTIYGTPRWANGTKKGVNRAPRQMLFLKQFATAAAKRYSGTFKRSDDVVLPAVRKWLAWNEPNNPIFLTPQWAKKNKTRYTQVAAKVYVGICTAVWAGVHSTHLRNEVVACGATSPRGNNAPKSRRPSTSPMAFLAALRKFGLRRNHFDAYAHHPYYGRPTESPTTKPKDRTSVTLANIGLMTKLLSKLYGNKKLWITEYGYQTRPPDKSFGVSWVKQAQYLTKAYAIARKNPRITMMLWFLLRDEGRLSGWQSGLFTAAGVKKPAYNAFRRLPH
ncbi:MAG: hypothetical protein LC685_05085 [Actinobacteria bacterium]|nr:hypothetical protein [Actinomycetota bacterium]